MTAVRRRLFAAALAALLLLAAPLAALAQTAVIVVRHAEKVDESEDPVLSASGKARAEALARHLRGAGIKAIYVTEYKRTALTAAPLAAALGLEPIVVPAAQTATLVARIRKDNAADVVLVVGHSNTAPGILEKLGAPGPVEIAGSEYDNLFVLVPRPGAAPALLRLTY